LPYPFFLYNPLPQKMSAFGCQRPIESGYRCRKNPYSPALAVATPNERPARGMTSISSAATRAVTPASGNSDSVIGTAARRETVSSCPTSGLEDS